MEFTVTYEGGVYRFLIRSTDPDMDYEEEFELTDLGEARSTVEELIERLALPDEEFAEDVWGDTEDE